MDASPITFNSITLIGSKDSSTLALTGVQLESTYQTEASNKPTKTVPTAGYSRINLDVSYTMGATETGNSIQMKIECSPDGTNFYRLPIDDSTTGTSTLSAREFTYTGTDASTATISVILDVGYRYMRISCKETGVVTNKGSVYVEMTPNSF